MFQACSFKCEQTLILGKVEFSAEFKKAAQRRRKSITLNSYWIRDRRLLISDFNSKSKQSSAAHRHLELHFSVILAGFVDYAFLLSFTIFPSRSSSQRNTHLHRIIYDDDSWKSKSKRIKSVFASSYSPGSYRHRFEHIKVSS